MATINVRRPIRKLFTMLSFGNIIVWIVWAMNARTDNAAVETASPVDPVVLLSHNIQKISPECVVPKRPDSTQPTPLEQAFADSWKERCKLDQTKFTIIMTSNNDRIDIVRRNLALYTSGRVPSIAEIYIRWNGDPPARPGLYNPMTANVPVRLSRNDNSSLVNRWMPIPDLKTAYVFSHDDDMEIDPDDLEWAWRTSRQFQPAFTSFVGRRWDVWGVHRHAKYKVGSEGESYGMGTSASWTHASFMDVWAHPSLAPVHEEVDRTRNCEDIAMAFLIPHLTRIPPLVMTPKHDIKHWQFRESMVSGQEDHWIKRDTCSQKFLDHFGGELPPERDFSIQRGLSGGKRKIATKDVPNFRKRA